MCEILVIDSSTQYALENKEDTKLFTSYESVIMKHACVSKRENNIEKKRFIYVLIHYKYTMWYV